MERYVDQQYSDALDAADARTWRAEHDGGEDETERARRNPPPAGTLRLPRTATLDQTREALQAARRSLQRTLF